MWYSLMIDSIKEGRQFAEQRTFSLGFGKRFVNVEQGRGIVILKMNGCANDRAYETGRIRTGRISGSSNAVVLK